MSKPYFNLYETICHPLNLWAAYKNAARGKRRVQILKVCETFRIFYRGRRSACCGAARGAASRTSPARRVASGSFLSSPATSWVSAAPSRFLDSDPAAGGSKILQQTGV